MKYILIIGLLVLLSGCGGGAYYSGTSRDREPSFSDKYLAKPAYNSTTGKVEYVNPMPTYRKGQRPNYINYETGDVYTPVPGPGNSWMNYEGETIQPY